MYRKYVEKTHLNFQVNQKVFKLYFTSHLLKSDVFKCPTYLGTFTALNSLKHNF